MTRQERINLIVEVLEDWHGESYEQTLINKAVGEKPLHVLDLVLAERIVDALDKKEN